MKKFHIFMDHFTTAKVFGNFLHMNAVEACKSWWPQKFFGNEGKDMKQQNVCTANNKQYTVYSST